MPMSFRVTFTGAVLLSACNAAAPSSNDAAAISNGAHANWNEAANAADTAAVQNSGGTRQMDPSLKAYSDMLAAEQEGGMPGCFDPALQGRERAVAERLGGTPCENGGGASPPPATNARGETWIVGAWAESRAACQGDTGLIFDRNGTYTAAGSENGRWALSGNSLSFTALETFEMGEEGATPVRNPQPFRHRIVAHSANAYSSRAPDGSVMTMVRCP